MTTLLRRLDVRRGSPMLITLPFHRAAGLGFMVVSLGLGCRAVVPTPGASAADLLDLVDERRVETVVLTPDTLATLVETVADGPAPPSLRTVVTSGGRLDADRWRAAAVTLGPIVWNLYGGAIAGWCTLASPDELAAAPGTIGPRRPGSSCACSTTTAERSTRASPAGCTCQPDGLRPVDPGRRGRPGRHRPLRRHRRRRPPGRGRPLVRRPPPRLRTRVFRARGGFRAGPPRTKHSPGRRWRVSGRRAGRSGGGPSGRACRTPTSRRGSR